MKLKKVLRYCIVLVLIFSMCIVSTTSEIDATQGRLKNSTIRKCKGTWYGKHKNHWHYAKRSKKNKNFWYPKTVKSLGSKVPKACRS